MCKRYNTRVQNVRKNLLFDTASLTDPGMVRENNEDCSYVFDADKDDIVGAPSYGIYIVADGLGGHQAGEVASNMAVQIISATLKDNLSHKGKISPPSELIAQAIEKANTEIYNNAHSNTQLSTMGTTVTLGLRLNSDIYLGHLGDSRAYLIRKGRIRQLTEDHSVIASLLKAEIITEKDVRTHPDRGKIFRCLGISPQILADTYNKANKNGKLNLHDGDSLVFCTDGLTGHVSDEEILECINEVEDAQSICRSLVDKANERGGEDNISIVVVKAKSDAGVRAIPHGKTKGNPLKLLKLLQIIKSRIGH
jgi:protein phosphatase